MGEIFADDFDKIVLEALDDRNTTLTRADIDNALQQQQKKQDDDGVDDDTDGNINSDDDVVDDHVRHDGSNDAED